MLTEEMILRALLLTIVLDLIGLMLGLMALLIGTIIEEDKQRLLTLLGLSILANAVFLASTYVVSVEVMAEVLSGLHVVALLSAVLTACLWACIVFLLFVDTGDNS